MDKRSLIGTYFRQQAELLMPDPLVNPDIARIITCPLPVLKTQPVRSKDPANQSKQSALSAAPRTAATQTLKNRLSTLRPIEQLAAPAKKKAVPATLQPPEKTTTDTPPPSDKRAALRELYIAGCTLCHLAQTRSKFVFGSGNAEAPVMVIGEAPGSDEDEQGLPFVGAAGKLLTAMLAAIDMDRTSDTFITNVLKCHPPENRNPESSEIVACMPLLKRQIDIVSPKALLLLGKIAAHAVLNINDSVAKMRSRVFDHRGIPAMVVYHPAALLRNAEYKRPAWEDLQQFKKLLTTLGVYGSLRQQ